MKIILLGPPGSGKGIQGELLEQALHIPRLSVGALIRRLVVERSLDGIEAEAHMVKGEAIPAPLYMKIVGRWLLDHPNGFIVDNLVRTYGQLEELKKFQVQHNILFDKAFLLLISEGEARKRLLVRKLSKERPDESSEAIHKRFFTFYSHMGVIVDYFRNFGILEEINAERPVMEVHKAIIDLLDGFTSHDTN